MNASRGITGSKMLFAVLLVSAISDVPIYSQRDDKNTIFVWNGDPKRIPTKSSLGYDSEGYYPQFVFDAVLGSSGSTHIFCSSGPHRTETGKIQFIEHFVLMDRELERLQDFPVENGSVAALRGSASPDGKIYLAWADTGYGTPRSSMQIYLQGWKEGSWDERQAILDEGAEPLIFGTYNFFLVGNDRGIVDIFWEDWREWHPLRALMSMGHAGNVAKTFHRRLTSEGWESVKRVQRRGTFDAFYFEPLPGASGRAEVLWLKRESAGARVMRSYYNEEKWKTQDTGSICESQARHAEVTEFSTIQVGDNRPMIAYVCQWYEKGTGSGKSHLRRDLHVSSLVTGGWEEGPVLSRASGSVQLAWSNENSTALIFQEVSSDIFMQDTVNDRYPLILLAWKEGFSLKREIISTASIPQLFIVRAVDSDAFHVFFVEETSSTSVELRYRRGTRLK